MSALASSALRWATHMSIVELSFALRSMSLSSSAALLSAMSMAFLSSLLEWAASLALSLYHISLQPSNPARLFSPPVPLHSHTKQNNRHPRQKPLTPLRNCYYRPSASLHPPPSPP